MCIRLLARLMAVQVWLIYMIELQGKRKSDKTGTDYTYWRNVGTPLQAFSISKIRFPNGTVDFYYQHSPSVLERMTVSNSTHRVIKDVKLNSKLLSNNIGRWLTSVDISGDGKYSFSYNDVQFRHTNGCGLVGILQRQG